MFGSGDEIAALIVKITPTYFSSSIRRSPSLTRRLSEVAKANGLPFLCHSETQLTIPPVFLYFRQRRSIGRWQFAATTSGTVPGRIRRE